MSEVILSVSDLRIELFKPAVKVPFNHVLLIPMVPPEILLTPAKFSSFV